MTTSTLSTLTLNPKVAERSPRQDSLSDQMFDTMTLSNEFGHRNAARYLFTTFFGGKPTDITVPDGTNNVWTMNELQRQLAETAKLAAKAGCYDAADWIKNQLGEKN